MSCKDVHRVLFLWEVFFMLLCSKLSLTQQSKLCFHMKHSIPTTTLSICTGWVKQTQLCNEPLNNSHILYFRNLICSWLSAPKLRCRCMDISFSFIISRDIKSSIRNSDLNIFKKGRKTGYHFQAKFERYIYTEPLFYLSIKLSLFCFLFINEGIL